MRLGSHHVHHALRLRATHGTDTLNVASCCLVVLWRRPIASPEPLPEQFERRNSSLHTNPMGRRHSTTGQHDAGCCVAGSVFNSLVSGGADENNECQPKEHVLE